MDLQAELETLRCLQIELEERSTRPGMREDILSACLQAIISLVEQSQEGSDSNDRE